MLSTNNLGLQYGKRVLFDEVNLKFTKGNCYGVIGANGAGKSTFLKILSGEIDPNNGSVEMEPGNRMGVLSQNHFAFEEEVVLNTVMMGHKKMYDIMVEKDAIYMNPEATEAEGMRAADLENEYGEMGGWEAESDAATLLSNLGVKEEFHHKLVKELTGGQKVKVLLAQALFGDPDILLLDEPTNDLDAPTITWLADFLADFKNTVIVVSHDRYFMDRIVEHWLAFEGDGKIKDFTGNFTEYREFDKKKVVEKEEKVEPVSIAKPNEAPVATNTSDNETPKRKLSFKEKSELDTLTKEIGGLISYELYKDFQEMRNTIKKPLTLKAVRLGINKLRKLKEDGNDPIKVVEQSIESSWVSFYPLKDNGNNEPEAEYTFQCKDCSKKHHTPIEHSWKDEKFKDCIIKERKKRAKK